MIVFLVLYLLLAASLIVPIRRTVYHDFGWFGGYAGGLLLGLLWPLQLRAVILNWLTNLSKRYYGL